MREFLRQGIAYGASSVGLAVVELVATPALTRVFDTQQYGTRELISNGIAFVMPFAFLGLDFSFPAEYQEERREGRGRELLSTCFLTIAVWASFVAASAGILDLTLFRWPSSTAVVAFSVAAVSIVPSALLLMTKWALRFRFQSRDYATVAIFGGLSSTGLGVLGAIWTKDILGFFVGQSIGFMLAAAMGVWVLRDELGFVFDIGKLADSVRLGLPFLPATVASLAFLYVDRQVLGTFDAVSSVGVYALGWRIAGVSALVVLVLSTTWLPIAMREFANPNSFRRLTSDAILYSVLILGTLAVGLSVFAPEFVRFLAPPEFSEAARVVAPLAFAAVFQAIATIASASVFIARRPALGLAANAAAFGVNVLVAVLAVPHLSTFGAGLGVLAGYIVLAAGYLIAFRGITPLRTLPLKKISTVILLTAVTLVVGLLVLESGFLVRALLFGGYAVSLVVMGTVGRRELAIAREVVSRRVQ